MKQEIVLDNYEELGEKLDEMKARLTHSEQSIERAARNAFEEWGAQLKQIKESGDYRAHSPNCTWEYYCSDRWEMSDRHADRLIEAYVITSDLKDLIGLEFRPIRSETHIRPLVKLKKPEERATVWQRVTSNGSAITAKLVSAEVERYKAEQDKNWITLTEWNELEEDEQPKVLTQDYRNSKTFNKTNDSIEWARWSWNPVTGCLHNCPYCYARDFANRIYPQGFEPSFLPERLVMPDNTKQPDLSKVSDPIERLGLQNVFVCSMADLFGKWVPVEWINAVLESMERNPQWTFLLLTKFPIRMAEFSYPDNVWLGTTVDYQHAVKRAESAFTKIKASGFNGICWLSCEPLMENLEFSSLGMFDWVVMGGASSSTQTPEFRPPFEWIVNLHNQARKANCKIYQKTNLLPGISDIQRIREHPKRR